MLGVRCSGTGSDQIDTSTGPTRARIFLLPGDTVDCTFRLTDWLVPTKGRWRARDRGGQACAAGIAGLSLKGPVRVEHDGRRLILSVKGRAIVARPGRSKDVYHADRQGFDYTLMVTGKDRISGNVKTRGCITSRFTITAPG